MGGVTEGWESAEAARERARQSVREAFERGPEQPPERTCPTCGHVAATWRPRCPNCEKRYDRRWPWLSDRARWSIAALVVAIAAVIVWQSAPHIDQSKKARAEAAARAQAKRIAEERARITREQRPVRGKLTAAKDNPSAPTAERLAARREQAAQFRAAILANARSRIDTGEMDGPVKSVKCSALVRSPGNTSDEDVLSKPRGRYDCVAVQRDVLRDGKLVAYFGNPFVGTIDFRRGTYVLCRDNKAPSENGKALVSVVLDPSCIGAEGQSRVRDGYLLPDE
jgi:hypothetical protein